MIYNRLFGKILGVGVALKFSGQSFLDDLPETMVEVLVHQISAMCRRNF